MKKKKLKNLSVTKTTISNLNQQTILGGDFTGIIVLTIDMMPQRTVTTCSKAMECDSVAACTAHVCKTHERDTNTKPVC